MTKFVGLADPSAVAEAVRTLQAGGARLVPTDTAYGLASLDLERLYSLKDRPASVPIATLVDSIEQARSVVRMSASAERAARAFWPGPLTIVFERLDGEG